MNVKAQPASEATVTRLYKAAMKSMEAEVIVTNANSREVFSACLTITAMMIDVMLANGVSASDARHEVQKLLLRCADPNTSLN